jgi:ATP-dependent Clp protease ATP-binding subunit ClpA
MTRRNGKNPKNNDNNSNNNRRNNKRKSRDDDDLENKKFEDLLVTLFVPPPPPSKKQKSQITNKKKYDPSTVPTNELFVPENQQKINKLSDLIKLAEDYKQFYQQTLKEPSDQMIPSETRREIFTFNEQFHKIYLSLEYLNELDRMIGMNKLKDSIAEQILFFVQNLRHSEDMMHTIICGPPGTGKTTVARILANVYTTIGCLSKGTFTVGRRTDFVAKYLGQTCDKTKQFLESCLGGVLFIDEAYSLTAHNADNDSYGVEAIDILNQYLSEKSGDFLCIIAGYEQDIEKRLLARNPGLSRRFPWKFTMDTYTADDLCDIFLFQLKTHSWSLEMGLEPFVREQVFRNNNKYFIKNNGGDCGHYFKLCKMQHSRRLFTVYPLKKREKCRCRLDKEDVLSALKLHKEHFYLKYPDTFSTFSHLYS